MGRPMGRVDSALAGVQERDKWLRRAQTLEQALDEILDRRHRLETRLRRLRKELQKLEQASREFVDVSGRIPPIEVTSAARGPLLR